MFWGTSDKTAHISKPLNENIDNIYVNLSLNTVLIKFDGNFVYKFTSKLIRVTLMITKMKNNETIHIVTFRTLTWTEK